jgi:hypothetical protein
MFRKDEVRRPLLFSLLVICDWTRIGHFYTPFRAPEEDLSRLKNEESSKI